MKLESPNKDLQDLRDKNIELAQHLQHWKTIASEKEKEKIECLKENKFLRMQAVNQRTKRTSINKNLVTVVKELSQHAVDVSNKLVKAIRILEDFQKQCLVTDEDFFFNNVISSPINNIQHVQPMVQGHSILKPVIALARTVIETPIENNHTSISRNIQVSARPIAQLLESYVHLERVDNENIRVSDDFITERRHHHQSSLNESREGDIGLEDVDDFEREVSQMNTTMVLDENVDFEDENDSKGTIYSRHNLSQIAEEIESQSINDISSNRYSIMNTSGDKSDTKFNLVPLVLLHRNDNEESNRESGPSAQPGPSWRINDSDEETPEKNGQKKRGRKKKQKSTSKTSKCYKDENRTNPNCRSIYNKENYHINKADSDSDSENSNYNEKLCKMLKARRDIDSLKPVTVVVNKLDIKEGTNASLPNMNIRRSSTGDTIDNTSLENENSSCSLPERVNIDLPSENGRNTGVYISSDVNYFSRESDDNLHRLSSRSRRAGPKDYKEVPLNKKLRRT